MFALVERESIGFVYPFCECLLLAVVQMGPEEMFISALASALTINERIFWAYMRHAIGPGRNKAIRAKPSHLLSVELAF